MKVDFTIDSSEVSALNRGLALAIGKFDSIAAGAITTSAIEARKAIRRDVESKVKGGATPWTKRGLIVRYATKDNLRAMVGYQYGGGNWEDDEFTPKGGGVPAGRYMGLNARGGDRRPKATELALRRFGAIRNDQFITPNTRNPVVRLNAQGNVPGGQYQQMLSRVGALAAGSSQNANSGKRSTKSRADLDYFVLRRTGGTPSRWQLGAEPSTIAMRAGPRPKGGTGKGSGNPGRPQTVGYRRGFKPAFNIVDQPNYERRFPIQSVAMREFRRVFPGEFDRRVQSAWRNLGK